MTDQLGVDIYAQGPRRFSTTECEAIAERNLAKSLEFINSIEDSQDTALATIASAYAEVSEAAIALATYKREMAKRSFIPKQHPGLQ